MLKREEVNGINKHGKDILNGQLTYSIVVSILVGIQTVAIIATMFFPGNPFLIRFFMHFPIYVVTAMLVSVIIFGISPGINAIRVYNGKDPWKYPLKINFFK